MELSKMNLLYGHFPIYKLTVRSDDELFFKEHLTAPSERVSLLID